MTTRVYGVAQYGTCSAVVEDSAGAGAATNYTENQVTWIQQNGFTTLSFRATFTGATATGLPLQVRFPGAPNPRYSVPGVASIRTMNLAAAGQSLEMLITSNATPAPVVRFNTIDYTAAIVASVVNIAAAGTINGIVTYPSV